MATLRAKYTRCTESELYAIAELAINNLDADLALFAAKKAKYTALFITGLQTLLTNAKALPSEEERNGMHQILKGQLPGLLAPVKQDFKDLQGYIRDAWPTEDPKPRYEQAGLVSYNKIGDNNWENVGTLNQNMTNFITDNTATLTAPGGMPAGFAAQVGTNFTAFKTVYDNFLVTRETSTAAAAKVTANNALFDAMMDFMEDGTEMVFNRDEANKKRYTFQSLKDIVSPPGSASLTVTVKKGDDTFAATGTVKIKKEGVAAIMAQINEGLAAYPNLDTGKYEGEVVVDGVTKTFTKEVNTGTDARITVVI
ncbi:MAG: hypothetical protein ACHQNT_08835 [Bacteroidia bacterium]